MARTRLSALGAMLADETRSEILCALMDGRAHTGGEIAKFVGASRSSTSEHLSKLQDGGFVSVTAQGRHRYFRLANPEVAELLEAVGAAPLPTALPIPRAPAALAYARTCYNHLAGDLAVQIYDQMLADGHIEPFEEKLLLTATGEARLADLGVDVSAIRKSGQATVRPCLDWTQRRPHLAGRAANAMLDAMLERGWIARDQASRSVRVTETGKTELFEFFPLPRRDAPTAAPRR